MLRDTQFSVIKKNCLTSLYLRMQKSCPGEVSSGTVVHMKGETAMDVISELDTLCIVAREAYGNRGVVLASGEPRWFVAGPADEPVEPHDAEQDRTSWT